MDIPRIGIGTFRLKDDVVKQSVRTALELGYTHIDTAQVYGNEAEIGEVLSSVTCDRDKLFLTTKVWTDRFTHDEVIASLKESVAKLQTDYVDLALIHWPSPNDEVPLKETLAALMKAKQEGLTRNIGVSNFTTTLIEQAVSIIGAENIYTNQIEVHPFLQNQTVVELCQSLDILVTAYMPLAVGKVMQDPTLQAIAREHDITPADVSMSFLLDQNMVVIPSSTNPAHIKSNLSTPVGILTEANRRSIQALDAHQRIANPDFAPAWD